MVHYPHPPTHRPELGCVDGVSAVQARRVPEGLGRLFRHLAVFPSGARHRRLDPPPSPHVLLEAVALCADQGATPVGVGHLQTSGAPHRHQQQKRLAAVEDTGDPQRDDQRRVEATGIDQLSRPLDKGAGLRLIFVGVRVLNRPVRTRMLGGVGRAD